MNSFFIVDSNFVNVIFDGAKVEIIFEIQ